MAHSAIHFSLGAVLAAAWHLPLLARAWRRGGPLYRPFRAWLRSTVLLGSWAVAPALLRRAGLPAALCESGWMNVFLLHPWIARRSIGGGLAGPLVLAGLFALQYGLLVGAMVRAERFRRHRRGPIPRKTRKG